MLTVTPSNHMLQGTISLLFPTRRCMDLPHSMQRAVSHRCSVHVNDPLRGDSAWQAVDGTMSSPPVWHVSVLVARSASCPSCRAPAWRLLRNWRIWVRATLAGGPAQLHPDSPPDHRCRDCLCRLFCRPPASYLLAVMFLRDPWTAPGARRW